MAGPLLLTSAPLRRRVFFALWPDHTIAAALHETARGLWPACGGRLMRRDTLHLTLAFLGEVPNAALDRLSRAAARIEGAPFVLELDRVGSWHGQRIVWLAPHDVPAALSALVGDLDAALEAEGFALEARPFSPHVTLLRNACSAPPATGPAAVRWPVSAFALLESVRGVGVATYRVLGSWPLAGK